MMATPGPSGVHKTTPQQTWGGYAPTARWWGLLNATVSSWVFLAGSQEVASSSARMREDAEGDHDGSWAPWQRHATPGSRDRRDAGGATRDERGTRARGAGRSRRRAWWPWLRPWRAPLRPWRPWLHRAALRGVHLAVLGPILGPVWLSAGRRRPTPLGLCSTCPVHLVLLRQSSGVLPVCATVPRRVAPGQPDAASRRGRPCWSSIVMSSRWPLKQPYAFPTRITVCWPGTAAWSVPLIARTVCRPGGSITTAAL